MQKTISAIKKQYKDEWVLVDVAEEDELNQPKKGTVLTHSENRDVIYERMKKLPKGFRVATFYTGKRPPNGMVFAF